MDSDLSSNEGWLVGPATWLRIRKPIISVFVSFHLLLILCWMFPIPPVMSGISNFFFSYILFIGIDQSFMVFVPVPRHFNPHIEAVVTYKDGSERLWAYPRMERLDYIERMFRERYRKFGYDGLAQQSATAFKIFLPDVARYIARNNNDENNPPVLVSITSFKAHTPPPEEGLGKPLPPHFEHKPLFTYVVRPEDLK